jgi:hypothetical protein
MYRSAAAGYLAPNMPSALTMLDCYQRQLADARGAGLHGVGERARLGGTIRALIDVVNTDYDPRAASGMPAMSRRVRG